MKKGKKAEAPPHAQHVLRPKGSFQPLRPVLYGPPAEVFVNAVGHRQHRAAHRSTAQGFQDPGLGLGIQIGRDLVQRVTVTEQDGSWVFAPASPTAGLIFCLFSAAQRRTPGDLERISGGPSAYSTLDQRFFVTSRISFIWFASASKILPASSSSCPDTAFASSIRFVFSKHFTFSRSWLQR